MATQGGPAKTVSAQASGRRQGGAAIPVAVVADGRAVEGGAALPIYVVTSGPVQGGPALPVVAAGNGAAVAAGLAVPVYVVSGSLTGGGSSLSSPSFANMNTTVTNDLSSDGTTWAAVHGAFTVDQYGKYIVYMQRYNGGTPLLYFVLSNNKGASWADNTGVSGGEGFLVRGAMAYDAARDCFHGLVYGIPSVGGIIYRRYSITRDGSNNITSIARVAGVSVILDNAGGNDANSLEFPTIIMPDSNTLLAAWGIRTASGGDIRCCKCNITSNADAGGTASNWVHIGVNSTTTLGVAPAVASYTIPFTQTDNNLPYFSLLQLASGDLRWVYHADATPRQWRTRRSVRNAAVTWNSLSSPVTITNVQRAGTDTGYALKYQLVSQLSEDAAGNTYVGLATWKSNAAGDTWSIFSISSADAIGGPTDVYSAGGAHSFAPTGDAVWDSTSARLAVSYIVSGAGVEYGYIGLYNSALVQQQAPQVMDNSTPWDIPLLYPRDNGKLLAFFRVQGTAPRVGRFGTLTWG